MVASRVGQWVSTVMQQLPDPQPHHSPAHHLTLHGKDHIQKHKLLLLNLPSLWEQMSLHHTDTTSSLIC